MIRTISAELENKNKTNNIILLDFFLFTFYFFLMRIWVVEEEKRFEAWMQTKCDPTTLIWIYVTNIILLIYREFNIRLRERKRKRDGNWNVSIYFNIFFCNLTFVSIKRRKEKERQRDGWECFYLFFIFIIFLITLSRSFVFFYLRKFYIYCIKKVFDVNTKLESSNQFRN